MSYTITLHDHPSITEACRDLAERRYRQVLEHALGGDGGVILSWRAWQDAEETYGAALTEDQWRQARRWIIAADRARAAALVDIEQPGDAAFEVRPDF